MDVEERRRLDDAVQDELDLFRLARRRRADCVSPGGEAMYVGAENAPTGSRKSALRGGRGAAVLPEKRKRRQPDGERE